MSENEVQDVVVHRLEYTCSGNIRDTYDSRYDSDHQDSQINEVRRINALLGDADYVNFVIRDFDDAFAPNDSEKLVLWTTLPVIVHKSNGEVFAIRPEQAEEIMRSVGVMQDIAVYNGDGIKRMERPSGERVWPCGCVRFCDRLLSCVAKKGGVNPALLTWCTKTAAQSLVTRATAGLRGAFGRWIL